MTEPVVPLDDKLFLAARDVAEIEFRKYREAGVSEGGAMTAAVRVALDVVANAGPALPAPEPPLDSTNFGLLTRATELLMANEREYAPSNAASDWYLREQRVLALVREVTTRGAAPAPPDPKEP